MVYVNSLDTLTFENKEFICEQKEFSKPSSFFNADECKNGFVSSYYSKKLDLEFTYFIMTYDDWSDFSISSIHFIKDARNPKGKNDLNIQIDSVDIINKPSPVKTLTFKHGLLQSFIDSSNKIWTKVEIAN
ncbi:MAG: hypothetical protein IPI93_14415 [Sphingobacteriaceae bacterium]|nr:hypothetical protein [Sphingobacteriaceae bacterium]